MDNPYTKTEADEQWRKSTAVPYGLKLRWLWFHYNGTLWMSSNRISHLTRYPRDYILPILERYMRRFGRYVSEDFFYAAYRRIEDKHNLWNGNASRPYPDMSKWGKWAEGPFCAVDFENPHATCSRCGGSDGYLFRFDTLDNETQNRPLRHIYHNSTHVPYLNEGAFHWLGPGGAVMHRCQSKFCQEVEQYLKGTHDLNERAKLLRVAPRRPIKLLRKAESSEERFLIAAAALLDYEARYQDRLIKLKEVK